MGPFKCEARQHILVVGVGVGHVDVVVFCVVRVDLDAADSTLEVGLHRQLHHRDDVRFAFLVQLDRAALFGDENPAIVRILLRIVGQEREIQGFVQTLDEDGAFELGRESLGWSRARHQKLLPSLQGVGLDSLHDVRYRSGGERFVRLAAYPRDHGPVQRRVRRFAVRIRAGEYRREDFVERAG